MEPVLFDCTLICWKGERWGWEVRAGWKWDGKDPDHSEGRCNNWSSWYRRHTFDCFKSAKRSCAVCGPKCYSLLQYFNMVRAQSNVPSSEKPRDWYKCSVLQLLRDVHNVTWFRNIYQPRFSKTKETQPVCTVVRETSHLSGKAGAVILIAGDNADIVETT